MQGMATGFESYVKNVVFMNYVINTKVGTMVYMIITTAYFWDLMYVFILKNIYATTIQYYRLVNSLYNLSVPSGDIGKAYILFEALLNNLYCFYCNSCGYYR